MLWAINMSCVLSIIGKNLNVDELLSSTKLKVAEIRHKGEAINKLDNTKKLPYSYVSILTSNAEFDKLQAQINDTIKYLKRNFDKLKLVSTVKNIDYFVLNFGIDLTINKKNILTQNEMLPSKLLKLCGDLNIDIELSIYPKDLELILDKRTSRKHN